MPAWIQGWEPKDVASVIIATVALAVSILSAWFSRSNKRAEDSRNIRAQMNELVASIIDVQMQSAIGYNSAQRGGDIADWTAQSSALNQKIISLARIAVYLDNQMASGASDTEYHTIAQALAGGNDPLSETYWNKAIRASPNPLYEIFNRRGYANYLFAQGKPKDGREMYSSCLLILKDDVDFTKYTDGYTHMAWGVSERAWGVASEAETQFGKAQEKYEQLQRPQMRETALRELAYWRAQSPEQAKKPEVRTDTPLIQ